jgi:hypothetical protein
MAEVLGVPVYAESRGDERVSSTYFPIDNHGIIEELLND